MGYRALLRRYIQQLELELGDNFIEAFATSPERLLTDEDLVELRRISRDVDRDINAHPPGDRIINYNYRFRTLSIRYGLDTDVIAEITAAPVERIRAWRASPRSGHYRAMSAEEFQRFEDAINHWLESA